MAIAFEDVSAPQQILLVEDEKVAREALAQILRRREYEVVLAESASRAILQARKGGIGVVLMDIVLGGEMDGIEAAQEIQYVHPFTSFIFVSAYAGDPLYKERIHRSQVRIGGLLEKPIDVQELVDLIQKESRKLQVLVWLDEIQQYGANPLDYLVQLEGSIQPEIFNDVLQELQTSGRGNESTDTEIEEIRPLGGDEENSFMDVALEIDSVYSEIRNLVAQRRGDLSLKTALRPLRERLERLQNLEADAMEHRFRSQLQFDPHQGRQLLKKAEALLGNTK